MHYRVPGLDEEAQEDLAKLARRPRTVELVCATDGSTRTFIDDGAGISDSGVTPNGRRAQLYKVIEKRLFIDGDIVPAFFAKAKIKGIWKGDPLAAVRVLDAEGKKLIEKLKARRAVSNAAGAAAMIADKVPTKKPVKKAAVKAIADE